VKVLIGPTNPSGAALDVGHVLGGLSVFVSTRQNMMDATLETRLIGVVKNESDKKSDGNKAI
jgi:hypothetical protein